MLLKMFGKFLNSPHSPSLRPSLMSNYCYDTVYEPSLVSVNSSSLSEVQQHSR